MNTQHLHLSFACSLLICSAAFAQSINIDFGDGAKSPPADYAAAGLAGVWNTITAPFGVASPLVDLDGSPTGATVVHGGAGYISATRPAAGEPHNALMDDGVGGVGDILSLIQFNGLLPGDYEIIIYAWHPNDPAQFTAVFLGDFAQMQVLGGPWPGDLEAGLTHAHFEWTVSESGVLEFAFAGGIMGNDGIINGVQLRRIEPTPGIPGDLTGDGTVGVEDLLILLASWGPCAACDDCPADLDGDCNVGVSDLLILLANWG